MAELYERFPMLGEKRRAAARTLSGGQRQILAMAMALMNAPDLLLLDEPTAGLSPRAAEELFGTILALNGSGVAILMVEQNALEALSVSARAYVLVQGRPEREGKAADAGRRSDGARSLSRRQGSSLCSAADGDLRTREWGLHMTRLRIGRRAALAGGVAALASPAVVRAQADPIKLATLTPLTGAGGPYGPVMAKAAAAVVEEVNKAGGVLGRRIVLVSEDDQTNPEAAVRAARKLIDVDKVSAIMGTWASSVTTAVAPLCWESKTFLCTVSGADSITLLPHQGFLIRTQPNSMLQVTRVGEFILSLGAKKVFTMIPQTPFAQSTFDILSQVLPKGGGTHQSLIYDDKKTTYRTEVDQALRTSPDVILANGYTPDTVVLLKDLYRAGFKGKILGFAYSINQKLVDQIGQPEVVEGVYTFAPSPAEGSAAFEKVEELRRARPIPIPTPARSTTTSTWC